MTNVIESVQVSLGNVMAGGWRPFGAEDPDQQDGVSVTVDIAPVESPSPGPSPSPTETFTPSPTPAPGGTGTDPLAQTGGDPALLITALVVGGILVALGVALVAVRRARRRREQTHG